MFIDSAKIWVKSGNGGRGCLSFYRDKFTRHGIPDGGDGGRGSDIIIKADRNIQTLLDFQYRRHFQGAHGGHGSSKKKKGKDAAAVVVRVPLGTVIYDTKSGSLLSDLTQDGQEVVVARGGKGGLGNRHHLSQLTPGQDGQEYHLLLDFKSIADVGVVGFPNAGKSTLIAAVSNAHPKIAAYPFTTKAPVLGVARLLGTQFVIADIPGLIKGSSQGRGLGDKFLRHIERTKLILHLVDISGCEGRDPVEDYQTINQELKAYGREVFSKPRIIAANKMDLEGSPANLEAFKKAVKKKVYPISALRKEGLGELFSALRARLKPSG